MKSILLASAVAFVLSGCATVPGPITSPDLETSKNALSARKISGTAPGSYANGAKALQDRLQAKNRARKAKNVVLFIGDGMGVSSVTAIRIHAGQKLGFPGEEHVLTMESLPHLALAKTYNTDQQVSDSAGTASAMMTGEKTRAGVLNISGAVKRSDCANALLNPLTSFFETASENGFATGVVSTARITHATPAATYAQSPNRNWESESELPELAKTQGCSAIATQMRESIQDGTLDVVLGGGRGKFPTDIHESLPGTFVDTKTDLKTQGATGDLPLVGLFSKSHMEYMAQKSDESSEPTLTEMTETAINRLQGTGERYVLMVESGRIDHGHHAGKAELALEEGVEFDAAIKAALDTVDLSDTLVIVTADHSHVFTIAGYPTRGNPILGSVIGNDSHGEPKTDPELAADGLPYTTLGYQNGPGAIDGVRSPDLRSGTIIRQKAAIPSKSESHGGEDVPVFATGPASDLVSGVIEQNTLYHIMRYALGF